MRGSGSPLWGPDFGPCQEGIFSHVGLLCKMQGVGRHENTTCQALRKTLPPKHPAEETRPCFTNQEEPSEKLNDLPKEELPTLLSLM